MNINAIPLKDKLDVRLKDYCSPTCTEFQKTTIIEELNYFRECLKQEFRQNQGYTFEEIQNWMLTGRMKQEHIDSIKQFIEGMSLISSAEQKMFEYDTQTYRR